VTDRQIQDGPVTAHYPVGEPAAEKRHEERGGDEVMVGRARIGLAPPEGALHVGDEDGAHPVEAEAFAGLAEDDVLDLARVPRSGVVHRAMMPRRLLAPQGTGRCRRTRRVLRRRGAPRASGCALPATAPPRRPRCARPRAARARPRASSPRPAPAARYGPARAGPR